MNTQHLFLSAPLSILIKKVSWTLRSLPSSLSFAHAWRGELLSLRSIWLCLPPARHHTHSVTHTHTHTHTYRQRAPPPRGWMLSGSLARLPRYGKNLKLIHYSFWWTQSRHCGNVMKNALWSRWMWWGFNNLIIQLGWIKTSAFFHQCRGQGADDGV